MKIIYNKYYPLGPFHAQNVLGIIFCRIDKGKLSKAGQNHEYIHTVQQKELLYIGFLLWYHIEWLIRFIMYRDWMKAYYALYFEREAYDNQRNLTYCENRKPYAWADSYLKEGSFLREFVDFIKEIYYFVEDDFKWTKYLYVLCFAVMIAVAQIYFNFYDHIISPSYQDGTSMIRLPMVYVSAYYAILIPTLFMHGEGWRLKQWQVWVFPILLVTIDGAAQGFDTYEQWIYNGDYTRNERNYLFLVGSFFFRSVAIVLFLCLFKWLTTGQFGLYGVKRSSHLLRVYGAAYLCLVPIFVIVSFTPQFVHYYPKMHISICEGAFGWSNWKLIAPFELCYANDFLGVESMFRGAMIIGLSRWLGPRTVLPMIITYMCIHLGKPDLELCSSVIGGYILGILAYRTQHLWGGIIIHLGIAMLFEALGLMRIFFF